MGRARRFVLKRALSTLLLLTGCLPWDARLADCIDAGLCTPSGGGGGSAGGEAGGGALGGGGGGGGGGGSGGGSAGGAATGGSGGGSAGGSTTVARFTVTPAPLNFAVVEQFSTKDLTLTVKNTGDVALATPTAEPENQLLFSVMTNACSGMLAPDAGCTMTIRYAPIILAQDDKRLTVSAAPAADVVIHTLGTCTAPGVRYEISPTTLTFGPQQVGTSSTAQQVTFRNTGVPTLMLNASEISDMVGAADDFAIMSDGCGTTTQPTDAGCTVTVRFTPKSEGVLDAQLNFKVQGQQPVAAALSGTSFALTTLNVSRTGILSDGGRIYSDDGGIDCPGRCTHQAPRGSVVTLRSGAVNPLAHFAEWSAPGCAMGAATCDVTMQPDASVASARFDPYNRVFVMTPARDGALKATAMLCANAAMSGGLTRAGTSWVVGVNDSNGTLPAALSGSRSWVRPDGVAFADLPADVLTHRVLSPPMIGANGAVLAMESLWTGVDVDGGTSVFHCNNWQSTSGSDFGAQGASFFEADWAQSGSGPNCSTSAAVLCFETGGRAPLVIAPRPAVSRLAFVSAGSVPGNTSQAAADLLCNQEAGTVATNRFAALRANIGGVNAMVSFDGGTWYRPDHQPVFFQANDLGYMTRTQRVGISRQRDGGIVPPGTRVWTGGDPAAGYVPSNACNDWTSPSSSLLGQAGYTNSVGSSFFGLLGCDQQARLYCFER